jgi:hypothetical protein
MPEAVPLLDRLPRGARLLPNALPEGVREGAVALLAAGAIAAAGLGIHDAIGGSSGAGLGLEPAPALASVGPGSAQARRQIVSVLHAYERGFSQADITSIGDLFSPDVFRHGLGKFGCTDTRGRQAVMQVYHDEVAVTKERYRLTDLGPSIVVVNGSHARVNAHYAIGPAGNPKSAGTVGFELDRSPSGWLISVVAASC